MAIIYVFNIVAIKLKAKHIILSEQFQNPIETS
jgi:hypothetical protein